MTQLPVILLSDLSRPSPNDLIRRRTLRPSSLRRMPWSRVQRRKKNLRYVSRTEWTDQGNKFELISTITRAEQLPRRVTCQSKVGRKVGAAVPLSVGRAGSPSNAMWVEPKPTCMASFILIHPTVWLQYTNVTDRQRGQDRTDNGLIG